MSTVTAGRRVENLAKKELEKAGWVVDGKNRNRFKSPDLFGIFDWLAVKSCEVMLLQVTKNKSGFYERRKKVKQWAKENDIDLNLQVWLYEGRNKWRKEEICP